MTNKSLSQCGAGKTQQPLDCKRLIDNLHAFFATRATYPVSFRIEMLQALRSAIAIHEQDLLDALHADLRKPAVEAYASEIGFVQGDITHLIRHLPRWTRTQRRRTPLIAWPGRSFIRPEPRGVVLIIGPWNYPLQLLFSPLVAALAAGNCVCLKPSEFAPNTASAVRRIVQESFPAHHVTVVEGGRDETQDLLREHFDHVFFTGSTSVGRAVMEAAAKNLTPVTLELGGKCPCIVCHDADLDVAARRILWGKCLNSGQTCVAPDHVLVDERVKASLLDALKRAMDGFFGGNARSSKDFGRIINRAHFDRLVNYLPQGRIFCGGAHDGNDLFVEPTVLIDVDPTAPVMKEEIFGPILPVIGFENLDQVFALLRGRPKPLALYLFTNNRAVQDRVLEQTASGGVCVNDTVSHILGKDLPFGGVGASGMGTYHGKAGFDCFTHYRSVMRRSTFLDPRLRYPPLRISLTGLRRIQRFLLGR